jgi:hypothetical protein
MATLQLDTTTTTMSRELHTVPPLLSRTGAAVVTDNASSALQPQQPQQATKEITAANPWTLQWMQQYTSETLLDSIRFTKPVTLKDAQTLIEQQIDNVAIYQLENARKENMLVLRLGNYDIAAVFFSYDDMPCDDSTSGCNTLFQFSGAPNIRNIWQGVQTTRTRLQRRLYQLPGTVQTAAVVLFSGLNNQVKTIDMVIAKLGDFFELDNDFTGVVANIVKLIMAFLAAMFVSQFWRVLQNDNDSVVVADLSNRRLAGLMAEVPQEYERRRSLIEQQAADLRPQGPNVQAPLPAVSNATTDEQMLRELMQLLSTALNRASNTDRTTMAQDLTQLRADIEALETRMI